MPQAVMNSVFYRYFYPHSEKLFDIIHGGDFHLNRDHIFNMFLNNVSDGLNKYNDIFRFHSQTLQDLPFSGINKNVVFHGGDYVVTYNETDPLDENYTEDQKTFAIHFVLPGHDKHTVDVFQNKTKNTIVVKSKDESKIPNLENYPLFFRFYKTFPLFKGTFAIDKIKFNGGILSILLVSSVVNATPNLAKDTPAEDPNLIPIEIT